MIPLFRSKSVLGWCALLLALAPSAPGQFPTTLKLTVQVLDGTQPVPGAAVKRRGDLVLLSEEPQITDASGFVSWTVQNISGSGYTFEAMASGFKGATATFKIGRLMRTAP